ncbi:MAG TPA: hypothetical protein VGH89_03090 [Pseudonocardia sp.]|jgi:RNA polymerase sigma-70 factor (ECF subfamily)
MDPFSAPRVQRSRANRRAEFAQFHHDNHPRLVALLHVLHGNRAHALRVAQRAFTQAWVRWSTVRSLPDPAGWTRRTARRLPVPRQRPNASTVALSDAPTDAPTDEIEWIAARARPSFAALHALPTGHRTLLALRYLAGLSIAEIADEERLPVSAVIARLAVSHQRFVSEMRLAAPSDLGIGPAYFQRDQGVIEEWAAAALVDLGHALTYRTDQHAVERVFQQAVRQRAKIRLAAASVLLICAAGGVLTVRYAVPGPPILAFPRDGIPTSTIGPPRSAGTPPSADGSPLPTTDTRSSSGPSRMFPQARPPGIAEHRRGTDQSRGGGSATDKRRPGSTPTARRHPDRHSDSNDDSHADSDSHSDHDSHADHGSQASHSSHSGHGSRSGGGRP